MKQKRIVTIQDISCFGRCSLGVALPIISATGIEVCPLPTAVLSTHTGGFKNYSFTDLTNDIPKIKEHWKALNLTFNGIYTGYLGSISQIKLTKDFIETFTDKNTLVMIDPVMADFGKLYVGFDNKFPEEMAQFCGVADVIVPNLTEACLLTGTEYLESGYSEEYIIKLLHKLEHLGAKNIIITGIEFEKGKTGPIAYNCKTQELFYYGTEKINKVYHGTGDVFSSAVFACLVSGITLEQSIKTATDFTVASICRSYKASTDSRYGVNYEEGLATFGKTVKQISPNFYTKTE